MVDGLQGVERLFVSSMKGQDSICTTFALTVVNRLMRLNTKGESMSEIDSVGPAFPDKMRVSEAFLEIFDQIKLLHKRIDEIKESIAMIKAWEGEK
jgi:hypothetical protein